MIESPDISKTLVQHVEPYDIRQKLVEQHD